MAGHVFISHGSEDRDEANELCAFVESHGVKAWIAPRDVRPGGDYSEELQAAIESCVAFVVLVTEMANRSPYVRAETEMAFSNSKPIFPIRTTDIKPAAGLAFFLKIRHWTDAFGKGRDAGMARLALELQTLSGVAPETKAEAPAPAPAPPQTLSPVPPPATAAAPLSADEELLAAAVGPNADYFLDRWRKMDARKTRLSWNWAACFLNLFWFAFRKMWIAMLLFVVATLLLGTLELLGDNMVKVEWILFIGMSFVTGYFGNHWYRLQTEKLVAEVAALDRQAALDQLRRRGGISQRGLFISLGVVALVIALSVIAQLVEMRQQMKQEMLRQQQLRDHENALQAAPPPDQMPVGQQEPAEEAPPPAEVLE